MENKMENKAGEKMADKQGAGKGKMAKVCKGLRRLRRRLGNGNGRCRMGGQGRARGGRGFGRRAA